MRIKDIGEIALIKRISKNLRLDSSVIHGAGDDTAVIKWTKDKDLLFTCDMLVEGVHFRLAKATPRQIGWKALCRNVSDIAAMGGVPRYALVSASLRPGLPLSFADGLYKGLRSAADRFGVNLVGGDMCHAGKIVIDVSLIGEAEKKGLVTRSGARKGDLIFVTGAVGGSIKGKHLNFTPRLEEARRLVKNFRINAMIDVSDGLVLDLWRILDASGAGARIYQNTIPVSKDAASFEKAIYAGEDFELLFTMGVKEAKRFFRTELARMKTPVTLIGEVLDKKDGYTLVTKDGVRKRLKAKGYLHF
ncbi:MAG: thiamine-monophosphate kinase [Candidatus Omnitrophica bacterium]|nr:thiamine-monophosphate kinase [Candidatus Omnitrophota bacterium]